ncbi:MAG: lipoyl(octanoyl) transferase LipB [Hyphomonadaceae bacterium]
MDLLTPDRFPVFKTGRGGQFTYRGPGQRVAYVMLDLRARGRDVSRFVADLERWIIAALAQFNLKGEIRDGRIGVWVERKGPGWAREGQNRGDRLKLRKWVSFHGIAFNVEPDLEHFTGITPCGISAEEYGVTSLVDLGLPVTMADADAALRAAFEAVFAPTTIEVPPA